MWQDWVSNPGLLAFETEVLLIALCCLEINIVSYNSASIICQIISCSVATHVIAKLKIEKYSISALPCNLSSANFAEIPGTASAPSQTITWQLTLQTGYPGSC